VLLAIYGANSLLLTALHLNRRRQKLDPPPPAAWPAVTVQLPVFNELHVVERLLGAVARLDYPRERLQVQVLDDSTDDTTAIVAGCVERYRALGLDFQLLHRSERPGFKAGALAAALPLATGELIAIFDADFVPEPDFLLRTVPAMLSDPAVGYLQTRWAHLNENYSLLTQAQALALDGHFVVEQSVRQQRGWFFGFNGAAGLWRRDCIAAAGGWQADTLCEDLDLSYRAQLHGWRGLYLCDVAAPAEIPPQLAALKRQQARWATGSIQTMRKLAWMVARSDRALSHKVEGLIHLGAYFCHPLLLLLLLLSLPMLWFDGFSSSPARWLFAYLGLASVGPPLLYAVAQWELHRGEAGRQGWVARLAALPVLVLLGTGLALSNSVAVLRGLQRRPADFRRTPKFQLEQRSGQWRDKAYALPLSGMVLGELALAGYAAATIAVALWRGHAYAVPFLALYLLGFGLMAVVGLVQAGGVGWRRSLLRPRGAGFLSRRAGYRKA
jgi:hypothetical protein